MPACIAQTLQQALHHALPALRLAMPNQSQSSQERSLLPAQLVETEPVVTAPLIFPEMEITLSLLGARSAKQGLR